ncbi:hypothetical protein FNV43_RR00699 [Rhamnella rubrinervis]|uniref:Uncharacterized protein n=1 Tax=Rhamnella rubrinervis TaxID=2594499 RepID=A0A8K0HP25_9ROSA|nr:hypothetical protein FNV43_RR00699 [Rhamnella rubrinervis]
MLANTLPTKEAVVEKTRIREPSCHFCGEEVESNLHIFKNCQLGRLLVIGRQWGCRLDSWKGDNIFDLLNSCLNPIAKMLLEGMECDEFLTTRFLKTFPPSLLALNDGVPLNKTMLKGMSMLPLPMVKQLLGSSEMGGKYAEQCGWRRVEWERDAKQVEKAVTSKDDPTSWYAYYPIYNIWKCFDRQGWEVKWRRSNNMVVDPVAKLSLYINRAVVFDEFSLDLISPCILDIVFVEQAAAVL